MRLELTGSPLAFPALDEGQEVWLIINNRDGR